MPRGAKPGERRGGRAKGTPNKKKAARALAIQIAGVEPKTFLLSGLGFYQGRINAELAKGTQADPDVVAAAFAAGREFAKDAAPYCHYRLPQAIQLGNSAPDGQSSSADDVFRIEFVKSRPTS